MSNKYYSCPAYMNSPHPSTIPIPVFDDEVRKDDIAVKEEKRPKRKRSRGTKKA